MYRLTAYTVWMILGCVMLFSCSSQTALPGADVPDESGAMVNLSFSVVVADAVGGPVSRSTLVTMPDDDNYFEQETGIYETLNTLRVIIIHNQPQRGRVIEHNRLVNIGDDGVIKSDNLEFAVRGGEVKYIYLIANEEAVGYDFDTLLPGTPYADGTLESVTFAAPDGSRLLIDNTQSSVAKKYIPMGETYDCFVPYPKQTGERFSLGTLFLTRAAVKFSFNVKALYGDGLYLRDITVNGLADREYLLPHNTFYEPPKGTPPVQNPPTAVDPSQSGRFITSYEIPVDARHGSFSFFYADPLALSKEAIDLAPDFYFCESMLGSPDPAPDGKPYTVSITIADADGVDVRHFDAVPLPNLPILPRNTHVKVNITLTDTDVACEVEVVPYTGVWLDPDFGIDR